MSEIDPGLMAFSLLAVVALVAVVVLVRGARKPPEPVQFYDEGSTKIENQPWSPTRGHYFFATGDLPEIYRELVGIKGTTVVQAFADDEADARVRLKRLFTERPGVIDPEALPDITGPVVKFRPLLKRKGQ